MWLSPLACYAPSADAPLVSSLADYLECHASAIGQNGFEGAANGFFMTAMLTGCLTIYVALIGYRLVLGHSYTVREAVLACVRVGLVLTFCTRWPSYEAVFYRTVVEGPQEIAGQMLQSAGLPLLSGSDLVERIQNDYASVQAASLIFPAPPSQSTPSQAPGVATPQPVNAPPPPATAPATTGYSIAGLVFLISTVGSLMAVHLAAALLMAIGPLVLLLALFDSLVGLLENWVAGLAGTMLATVGITIVTELELGYVEARLTQFRPNGTAVLTDQALFLTALLFSLCLIGVVIAAGFVGRRLKFRGFWQRSPGARPALVSAPSVVSTSVRSEGVAGAPPSRASAVAEAVREAGRRERTRLATSTALASSTSTGPGAMRPMAVVEGAGVAAVSTGLGSSLRRPASVNRSITYARRSRRQ